MKAMIKAFERLYKDIDDIQLMWVKSTKDSYEEGKIFAIGLMHATMNSVSQFLKCLIDRKGNIIEQLTSHAGINVSPSFSPDGQSMAFVSDRSGKPNVYVMNLASRQAQRLTFKNSENSEPAWSPKGDEIAFTGLTGGTYQLFIMDRNGGNVRQLTNGGNYESPTWAPDGRLIAVTQKGGGSSKVCVVSKNGKDVRTLFNFKGNQSYPQWSKRLP